MILFAPRNGVMSFTLTSRVVRGRNRVWLLREIEFRALDTYACNGDYIVAILT